jgi:peptide/nickel transport system permease protein
MSTHSAVAATDPGRGRERRKVRPRRGWLVTLSMVVIGVVVVLTCFGTWLAPMDPDTQDLALGLSTPSGDHWFGTDQLGRDVFSRVIAGTRSAVVGPIVIALGCMLIGNVLGVYAGYRGGRPGTVIMRWVDLMFALPGTLVIIVVAGTVGGGYWFSVALLIVLSSPFDTRIIRGATLEQVPRPYVEAAKSIGVPDRRIMAFHIWPNVAPVAVANTCLMFAGSLVALAGLSFLGLGVPAGTADWGLMVAEGRSLLFVNPVSVLAPATMIVLTATAVSLVGDWTLEHFSSRGATR